MSDHRAQVLEAMPAPKRHRKVRRTVTGLVIASFGVALSLVSFAALLRIVWTGAVIDKWVVALVALPMVGGISFVAVGSHVASGELVAAAWKDGAEAIRRAWRRNGNGGGS